MVSSCLKVTALSLKYVVKASFLSLVAWASPSAMVIVAVSALPPARLQLVFGLLHAESLRSSLRLPRLLELLLFSQRLAYRCLLSALTPST